MNWHDLTIAVRIAILREAVRRGVFVDDFARSIGVSI